MRASNDQKRLSFQMHASIVLYSFKQCAQVDSKSRKNQDGFEIDKHLIIIHRQQNT